MKYRKIHTVSIAVHQEHRFSEATMGGERETERQKDTQRQRETDFFLNTRPMQAALSFILLE